MSEGNGSNRQTSALSTKAKFLAGIGYCPLLSFLPFFLIPLYVHNDDREFTRYHAYEGMDVWVIALIGWSTLLFRNSDLTFLVILLGTCFNVSLILEILGIIHAFLGIEVPFWDLGSTIAAVKKWSSNTSDDSYRDLFLKRMQKK